MGFTVKFIGILLCVALTTANAPNTNVTYNGPNTFPGDLNATLRCQVAPEPDSPDAFSISWFKVDSASVPVKIGVSTSNPNTSYVMSSAPPSLIGRFTMSSDEFAIGTATAIIHNIEIGDDGVYECEIEMPSKKFAYRTRFAVGVYYEPDVTVEAIENDLDIRPTPPPVETPAPGTEEPPTGAEETTESTEATTTTTTVSTSTEPQGPVEVAIAKCTAVNAYPEPTKFKFTSDMNYLVWTDVPDMTTVKNADGTFNATAILRTVVTADLDKATIKCEVFLKDDHRFDSTGQTAPYTVRYTTSKTEVVFSKSTPTEGDTITVDCVADGNPAPKKYLTLPNGQESDVTDQPYEMTVLRANAGFYNCRASNSADDEQQAEGRLAVQYLDKPQTNVAGNTKTANFGDDLSFTCSASGLPTPSVVWKKNGKQISPGRTLLLNSVDYSNNGEYKCTANGAWRESTSFNLDVQGGCPMTFQKEVMASSAHPGQARVQLTCTALANPPCQVTIEGLDDENRKDGTGKAVLVIDGMETQANPLKYKCTAANKINTTVQVHEVTEEPACCAKPQAAGMGVGVIIIIVIIIALVVVGVPLACYFIKKRNSPKASPPKSDAIEEGEKDKLKSTEDAEA